MTHVRVEDIQKDLLGYLRKVEAGETLVILRADQPVAEIKPVGRSPRPYGLCIGEFTVPEDFDLPLPEDVVRSFVYP